MHGFLLGVGFAALSSCAASGDGPEYRWERLVDEDVQRGHVEVRDTGPRRSSGEYLAGAHGELADGEREDALEVLGEGIQDYPSEPSLLELRGSLLADSGYRRAAEKDFQRAVKAAPERADLWRALGEIQLELELPAAANQALRRCATLEPNEPMTLVLLARASRDCGQLERAAHLYGQALEDPSVSAEMLIDGASLYTEDRLRRHYPEQIAVAYRWLARALILEPDNPRGHFTRGLLFECDGKRENAAACYRRAIELDPYCLGGFTNLALLCAERGDCATSQEMALKAIALEGNPHRRRALRKLFEDPGRRELVAELRAE